MKFFFSKVETWRPVILLKLNSVAVVSLEFSKIFKTSNKLISGQCSHFIPPETVVNLEQRNTDWKWSWPKPIWLLKSWICWKTFIFNQIEEIDSVYDRVFSYHTCVHKKKQWKWLKEPLTFTVIEKWHVYYKIEILPCLGKKPFTGTFLRPAYKINHSKFFTKLRIWW